LSKTCPLNSTWIGENRGGLVRGERKLRGKEANNDFSICSNHTTPDCCRLHWIIKWYWQR
jgi:hypothetical protein